MNSKAVNEKDLQQYFRPQYKRRSVATHETKRLCNRICFKAMSQEDPS